MCCKEDVRLKEQAQLQHQGVVFMSGGITYDGHISMLGTTELELGSSENSYSRARKRSVIVVLEVSGCHTGCPLMNCCTAYGLRGLFVQLANQAESDIIS